ncbi:hypothetical protein [Candidatus Palauibacter sp.]|uniref:hypothetical protein n=1 Tax=Candidatus Palauibacter sp. TaxID=3101350 RepID=UPI003AF2D1ED
MSEDEGRKAINTAAELLAAAARARGSDAARGREEDSAAVEGLGRSMAKLTANYAATLERVLASVPKVHFPTVSLGRLEGLVELQRTMDAYQRRWQSLARQIVPPVTPGPDLSAIAASVRVPRPAATRDDVTALKQRVIAGEQRNRALEQEIVALKQRVDALEMQRVFPPDPDFTH